MLQLAHSHSTFIQTSLQWSHQLLMRLHDTQAAANYDWRLAAGSLEERDAFLTTLRGKIETMVMINKNKVTQTCILEGVCRLCFYLILSCQRQQFGIAFPHTHAAMKMTACALHSQHLRFMNMSCILHIPVQRPYIHMYLAVN